MKPCIAVGVVLFGMGILAWAQSTAQIHGTVRDASGSVVPGAEIKATQTDTGVVRSTTSAADGGYILTALPVGPYRLEITKDGFTKSWSPVLCCRSIPILLSILR